MKPGGATPTYLSEPVARTLQPLELFSAVEPDRDQMSISCLGLRQSTVSPFSPRVSPVVIRTSDFG